MPVIETDLLQPGPNKYNLQTYNGLDCCVTFEVHEELQTLFNQEPEIYGFERALQAPALEMMLRGFAIDEYERAKGIAAIRQDLSILDSILTEYALAAWGKPLNPRSPLQLQSFFYGHMGLPEKWISQKGIRKLSMNREVLEHLEVYFHARPIIATIFKIRELSKRLEVLETEVDPDHRMRTSYNIAGTETGRWSSSSNAFGTGTNLQNITPELRKIFQADPGWKLCGIDLEQAESREVGWLCGTLFNDWGYLDACEGGDLHTTTAKLIWPSLPWTGEAKQDRLIAEQPFYRHFSYRDMSKRGGHGTTYLGTPWTMSRHLKVPLKFMADFQPAFFNAYPAMPKWHRWTAQALQTSQVLTTAFGRTRHFFGRPRDDTTLREAIAYCPQSATADRLNLALWRVWKHMGTRVQILAQVHDALYVQIPEFANEQELVAELLSHISIPINHNGRVFDVPGEAKTGWNWGVYDPIKNPNGLKKFKTRDDRVRLTGLDRVL